VIKMGKVGVRIKVMPSEAGMDMEKFKEEITKVLPEYAQLARAEIMPVAFGLKSLVLQVIIPDQSPDELIEKIRSVDGVESAEIEEVSLI